MKAPPRWILEVLQRIEPNALPQSSLFVEMNTHLRPPLSEREFLRLLADLQNDQLIGRLEEKYESEPKWFIKEAGKTLLRK